MNMARNSVGWSFVPALSSAGWYSNLIPKPHSLDPRGEGGLHPEFSLLQRMSNIIFFSLSRNTFSHIIKYLGKFLLLAKRGSQKYYHIEFSQILSQPRMESFTSYWIAYAHNKNGKQLRVVTLFWSSIFETLCKRKKRVPVVLWKKEQIKTVSLNALIDSSFNVVDMTRTAANCAKMKNACAQHASLLFFLVKYADFSSCLLELPIVTFIRGPLGIALKNNNANTNSNNNSNE